MVAAPYRKASNFNSYGSIKLCKRSTVLWDVLLLKVHLETELGTNLLEDKIRPLALGRKNILFAISHDINPYECSRIHLKDSGYPLVRAGKTAAGLGGAVGRRLTIDQLIIHFPIVRESIEIPA